LKSAARDFYGREGSRYGLDDYMHTQYLCHGQLSWSIDWPWACALSVQIMVDGKKLFE